jgi:hypothetical protein
MTGVGMILYLHARRCSGCTKAMNVTRSTGLICQITSDIKVSHLRNETLCQVPVPFCWQICWQVCWPDLRWAVRLRSQKLLSDSIIFINSFLDALVSLLRYSPSYFCHLSQHTLALQLMTIIEFHVTRSYCT